MDGMMETAAVIAAEYTNERTMDFAFRRGWKTEDMPMSMFFIISE
jgi:hypothetical protein